MQFGTGGSSGYQSGNTSGSSNTNSSVNQTGASNVNQTGASTGSTVGATTGTTGVNTTGAWDQLSALLSGQLGAGGLTPEQTTSLARVQNYITGPNNAAGQIGGVLPQLQGIANAGPSQVSTPGLIGGKTAAQYAGQYTNPYENQVVQSTLGDLEKNYLKTDNQLRATYGGARGWSPTAGYASGTQLAAAENADNYLKTAASTAGNLRRDGFNTSISAGGADASRIQTADTQNVSNAMAGDLANANLREQGFTRSGNALQQIIGGALAGQGAAIGGNQSVYNMGGGSVQQLLAGMSGQTPAFGQTSTGSTAGTSTGTTAGNTSGTTSSQSVSDIIANIIGSSSGTSRGNQSGASVGGK